MEIYGSDRGGKRLEEFVRRAAWRLRMERLRLALGIMVRILLAAAVAVTLALIWKPEIALGAPVWIGAAAILLFLAADAALFWGIDRRNLLRRLDLQFNLADGAVSADELAGEPSDAWRGNQLTHTLKALSSKQWNHHWAQQWPRYTGLATTALIGFAALFVYCYGVEKAAAQPAVSPFLQSQYQALEEVFKDWEIAQEELQDPELQKLMEDLKPLREKLEAGELKEAEVLAQLSRVEDKLDAARKRLEAQSLEPFAAELAGAFEPISGMSAAASALRRKDFAQAEQRTGEMANKLGQEESQMPEGAKNAANQSRVSNLAQNMQQRGQESLSQALNQMQQGMKSGDPKQLSNGLLSLQQCFSKQAKRDNEKQRLKMQLAQMGQCKDCLGSGSSLCRGMSLMPKLAMQKKPGGKGAGSETDPNRFGGETQLASSRREEQLSGTLGAGDSDTQTESTTEQTREATSGPRQGNFRQYEKLSQEAIENENIPLAHRQSIRRYFELIRPSKQ